MAHVQFHHGTLDSYAPSERFDAVIGRYVLFHQADPTAFIRDAARHARPDGIVAFHEMDLPLGCGSCPTVPSWQETARIMREVFEATMPGCTAGPQLVRHFIDAGLPSPAFLAEASVGGGPDSPLYGWMVQTLTSLAPAIIAKQVATEAELRLDGLEDRLRQDISQAKAQIRCWLQVCAWATV